MKIKPATYLKFSLSIPYILLAISFLLVRNDTYAFNIFEFYLGMSVFWIISYTVVALVLLFWSRDKTAIVIASGFSISPFLVSAIFIVSWFIRSVFAFSSLPDAKEPERWLIDATISTLIAGSVGIGVIIIVGYIFIGIVAVLFGVLYKLHIIETTLEDFMQNKIAKA